MKETSSQLLQATTRLQPARAQPQTSCSRACVVAFVAFCISGPMLTGATPLFFLQGDVRFAKVMGLMGAKVEWAPYSITITGELAIA